LIPQYKDAPSSSGICREYLIGRANHAGPPTDEREETVTPEEEDKVVEALEELRINYNLRQWRVCSLICDSLADTFRAAANHEGKGAE